MRNYALIGDYFKAQRLKNNMSQSETAERLGLATSQLISNWERGVCAAPLRSARILSKIWKIPKKKLVSLYVEFEKQRIIEELE